VNRALVGFGFGPIQAGLFVPFARADQFERITVAEIDAELVRGLRANGGHYAVNVAHADRLETVQIGGLEVVNPLDEQDTGLLQRRLREASTIVTALPSPAAYTAGGEASVAAMIAAAAREPGPPVVVYTAENHPDAPARLESAVRERMRGASPCRAMAWVPTVIGKMSQTLAGSAARARHALAPITPGLERTFLVESFDRIVSGRVPEDCATGRLSRLIEQDDVRPYQELKLYGHNAAHLMLGLVARVRGWSWMTQLRKAGSALEAARALITQESGAALRRRWPRAGGELASEAALRSFATELVDRITSPWLNDAVERVIRDLPRKLARDDRLFGALSVCDQYGVAAPNLEAAAWGGVAVWSAAMWGRAGTRLDSADIAAALGHLWGVFEDATLLDRWASRLVAAQPRWEQWLNG